MTRAWSTIKCGFWWGRIFTRKFWAEFPRPGYCQQCHDWCWLTYERACYSTAYGFVCEECAIADEEEEASFWRSHYGYF